MNGNTSIFLVVSVALSLMSSGIGAQDMDGTKFRDDDEGDWYHPIEPESWVHIGSDLQVIRAVLSKIEISDGARRHADMPDTVMHYGPGNWAYEWTQAGDTARAAAASIKDDQARKAKLIEATSYYIRASTPHLHDPHSSAALAKASATYRSAGALFEVPLQTYSVPHDGKQFKVNLHLPEGEGPFPLVVMSFGSDVAKEEGLAFFEDQLAIRKIALAALDMPGLGESRAYKLTAETDKLHAATVTFMKGLSVIDDKNIFLMGASFGGASVARALLARPELDLGGVIYVCGLLDSAFVAPPEAYTQFPQYSIDGVKTRLGLDLDASPETLSATLRPFSLVTQGLMGDPDLPAVETPFLALTTDDDPVAPISDLEILLERTAASKAVVFEMDGHCPDRDAREAIAASWVADNLH